jgi:TolB-like protein
MVDEIITGLARIKGLFVIGRNSAFAFKARTDDIATAGRALGVRYVLQGSVRKAANRVRVMVQMVEAETARTSGRIATTDRWGMFSRFKMRSL